MTSSHRLFHRSLWLLLAPLVAVVLVLAARLPTEAPANPDWPAALPVEAG